MPTPANSSTDQSVIQEWPESPRPQEHGIHTPSTIPATSPQPGQRSCFSAPAPEASSSRNAGYTEYRPRPSISGVSAGFARGSRAVSTPWSKSSDISSTRAIPLDNWQALQDLVGDQAEQEVEILDVRTGSPQKISKAASHRSLKSLFQQPMSNERAKAADIPDRGGSTGVGSGLSGVLSTSPPQMDGCHLESFGQRMPNRVQSGRPSGEVEDERHDDANNGLGSTTPLLGVNGPKTSTPASHPTVKRRKYWPLSPAAIAIIKCTVAYFIASLFTFVPTLANLLSMQSETDAHGRVTRKPAYSAHMVATIVVYFNPAKTIGNMLLSTRFCLILAVLATLVSICSMATVHLFDLFSPSQGNDWDWISEIGDWVVCILWIGGSMGFLAWAKVWIANPSFNSGCSMAAVTIYTVVIKEGAFPKLLEVLSIVLLGACITNLTCFLIFPMSATSRFQTSISQSLTSFSTLLDLLTSTFLLKKNVVKGTHTTLRAAAQSHATAFKTLKTNLAEAKSERVLDPRIRGRKLELYDAAIGSLTRLAQHLAGLRGSTRLQESLIRANNEGRMQLELGADTTQRSMSASMLDGDDKPPGPGLVQDVDIMASVRLFVQFRDIAGSEMDALVSICDDALEAVQAISQQSDHTKIELSDIRNDLAVSLLDFSKCSSRAIKRLYAGPRRERGIYEDAEESSDEEDSPMQREQMNEGPNETVFLIYFFLFTLEEFAREMLFLLDTVTEILTADRISTVDHVKSLWPSKRGRKENRTDYLYKQFRQIVPVDPSRLQPPLFPRNKRDARGTLLATLPLDWPIWTKLRQRFWEFGDWLRTPNIRYAIKTGLGGAILAAPAYTEIGRPVFLEYRGEWALIAYFGAISPTVGQTNFLSVFRVVGTIVGAAAAVVFYTIFPENPIMLPILGVLFSIPCFYIITQMPNYAQAGRFTLLSYNLTCLYAYNSRERDLSPISIAVHRSSSVIAGVVWAAIVSRYWWPFTARRELRMGLSDFCLDLSYLYSNLVTTYSRGVDPPEPVEVNEEDEHEPLLPLGSTRHSHLSPSVRQFMAMELHLQSQLGDLRDLLSQTKNEPRLKGPFAFEFYQEVLLSCERMLDRLHSMRCVTTRDEWDNGIRRAFVAPVNKQRREMAGNVILYFYTLSAGFCLRTPMPPYLPPAEHARQRLVDAIRGLDVVKRRSVRGGGRHLLFFAYALAMQEVIAELEYLGSLLQDAFGIISQSTVIDFEALFEANPSVVDLVPRQVK